MPKSKNYNNWVKQNYPKQCDHCTYISNNPAMYSYHKKTHEPIPADCLCAHGCGQPALYRGTGGKYTCVAVSQQCPEYLSKHSARVKKQWAAPESSQRKEDTAKNLIKRLHNQQTYKKISETKRKQFGTLDPAKAKEFRRYARVIRQRAQAWAKEQGYILGQQTYHVDHKLSILDAWHAGLEVDVVNHPVNLQIIEAKENSSKGRKSLYTVEELIAAIRLHGELR